MAASDNLQPRQFRLVHEAPAVNSRWVDEQGRGQDETDQFVPHHMEDTDPALGRHMLWAHTGNNKALGQMTWNGGVVQGVHVYDTDRWGRQGMATQMFRRAQEITPGLQHSTNRSDMGNNWARKVGGPLPERMQDHPEWFTEQN